MTVSVDVDWRLRAACRGEDPRIFFPERAAVPVVGRHDHPDLYTAARRVCRGCEVKLQCLESVIDLHQGADESGMFAGLTPAERRPIRRCRKGECDHERHRRSK